MVEDGKNYMEAFESNLQEFNRVNRQDSKLTKLPSVLQLKPQLVDHDGYDVLPTFVFIDAKNYLWILDMDDYDEWTAWSEIAKSAHQQDMNYMIKHHHQFIQNWIYEVSECDPRYGSGAEG